MRKKIGECLVQAGLISEADLRSALAESRRTGDRLGVVLARMNLASETQIARALAFQLGFPFVSLSDVPPDPSVAALIPKDVALGRACVAVRLENEVLTVAMADPLLFSLVQDLELQTGCRIRQVVSTRGDIVAAIQACYPETPASGRTPDDAGVPEPVPAGVDPGGNPAPVSDLLDRMMREAIEARASDIHVDPTQSGALIRHRLDGVLTKVMDLPTEAFEPLIDRLKSMAGMDVAEKRLPQDGRLRVPNGGATVLDFRVTTLRTPFGEKVVLRALDCRSAVPAIEEIGLSAKSLDELRQLLQHPHGMILIAAPAASGKSTTLAASLKSLQSERTNAVTIEDPIEYQIAGVNQMQVDHAIGQTFASGLRSILRQDPDVVLVGEIRDAETATLALQAAQGARLVLTTLTADDAPSAVSRLMDIGTEPSVAAGVLIGVVAQRLVRRLCTRCRRPYTPSAETIRSLGVSEADASSEFYRAVGCDQCSHTGYRGRIGIFELMEISGKLRRLIASGASEDQIREAAIDGGMVTLGEDGLAKARSGVTTLEELLRVVTELREMRATCTRCGMPVQADFLACPRCGRRLGGACPHCGRALQPAWNFCPYCARSASVPSRGPKRPRDRQTRPSGRRRLPGGNVAEFKK